jgi:uncharacterized protein (DUF302 family)
MQTTYSFSKTVPYSFEEAIMKVTDLLKEEGFGILTTIDMKAKIKEKLGKDMEEYIILGACNPNLAYQGVQSEIELGLLLPCNIIIYKVKDKTNVAVIRPTVAMNMIDNEAVAEIAVLAEKKLQNVIKQL